MLSLQEMGCHNINLVSPTHVVPQVIAALAAAAESGLHIPIVYNTGGYDSPVTMGLLDGLIDIYMPDAKYASTDVAWALSQVRHYPATNRAMIREAHRQVGLLSFDERGIALRGLLVRHLVLPEGLAGSAEILEFIAREVSRHTYVNVMSQYRPCFKANQTPALRRRISSSEYRDVIRAAREAGLYRLDGYWRP